jgi:prevent-host-death family protein
VQVIDINVAKVTFSKLVARAAVGEDVIIAWRGRPAARLTQLEEKKRVIRFGLLKGKIEIAEDFDAPLATEIVVSSLYPGEFS